MNNREDYREGAKDAKNKGGRRIAVIIACGPAAFDGMAFIAHLSVSWLLGTLGRRACRRMGRSGFSGNAAVNAPLEIDRYSQVSRNELYEGCQACAPYLHLRVHPAIGCRDRGWYCRRQTLLTGLLSMRSSHQGQRAPSSH